MVLSASAFAGDCVERKTGDIAEITGLTLHIYSATKSQTLESIKATNQSHGGFSDFYFAKNKDDVFPIFKHIRSGHPPNFSQSYIQYGTRKFNCK